MTNKTINTHIGNIKMMSRDEVDSFAMTVHNAIGLDDAVKRSLLDAIDDRIGKLNNSFALEVEISEIVAGEVEV